MSALWAKNGKNNTSLKFLLRAYTYIRKHLKKKALIFGINGNFSNVIANCGMYVSMCVPFYLAADRTVVGVCFLQILWSKQNSM